MRFYLIGLTLITIALALITSPVLASAQGNLQNLWKKVSDAENDGLPQTAIEHLNEIHKAALSEKKYVEALKAVLKMIVLESNIKGNKPEEKVVRLKSEIEKADEALKPVMRIVLAQWYWHYFNRNSYRFVNRSATAGLNENDFSTWDLKKLFNEISSLHQQVLKDGEELKKIPLSQYYDILEKGNLADDIAPTVFDFACLKALDFYESGEQAGAAPEDAFELSAQSDALAESVKFVTYEPAASDTSSAKLIAVKLYQKLLSFHSNDKNKNAYIDADIRRLRYVRNNCSGENIGQIYIKRLEEIAGEYKSYPLSALAGFYVAEELYNSGDYVKALKVAEDAMKLHSGSAGAQNCAALAERIRARSFSVTAAHSAATSEKAKLSVKYANIDSLTFRIVRDDWRECLGENEQKSFNWVSDEELKKLLQKKPDAEWSASLKPSADFKQSQILIDLPPLKPGFYRVFASGVKDFSEGDNRIEHCILWISDMSVVSRERAGGCEGFVFKAMSGEALKGATLKLYTIREDYKRDRYVRKAEILETVASDENGFFAFKYRREENPRSVMLYACDNQGSEYFDFQENYLDNDAPAQYSAKTIFFTDRAIYRPGQIVNFKAIRIGVDRGRNEYKVLPNEKISVVFKDHNYQQIEKLELTSNAFGSMSGSFNAPSDRGTGVMRIESGNGDGAVSFSVEEYKRPKFFVEIKKPEESFKLGGEVSVDGLAAAYTGASIDSAFVKYRVVRAVKMPAWWFFWWGASRCDFSTADQEIAHGRLKTDAGGKFVIKFNALPDLKVPRSGEPAFDYRIYADVTDSAGETRSAEQTIRLGYTAMQATISADAWLVSNKNVNLSVETKTLDGNLVQAEGMLEIFELSGPVKPVRAELSNEFECFWNYDFNASDARQNDSMKGVSETADWKLWPEGKSVDKKGFNSDGLKAQKLEFKLAPGAYKAVLTSNDKFGNKVKSILPFMVFDDKASSFKIAVPEYYIAKSNNVEVGDKFNAFWATGYDKGRVFVEVIHDDKIIKKYWSAPGDTAHMIEVAVPEEYRGGFAVMTTFVKENRLYTHIENVNVAWSNKKYDVKFETFRSKLLPGQNETWTIKIKGPGVETKAAEFLAALYDESLDAFAPHCWQELFSNFKTYYCAISQRYSNFSQPFTGWIDNWSHSYGYAERRYPDFLSEITGNFYGYGFAKSRSRKMSSRNGGDAEMDLNVACEEAGGAPQPEMSKMAMDSDGSEKKEARPAAPALLQATGVTPAKAPARAEAKKPDLSKVAARKNLNETAFFFPHLLTEADGSVKITFNMPEALTKWHFMGFAHGKNLESGFIEEHAVTQKDLMVQPNPPRFLREGDELEFAVKVTNMVDKEVSGAVKLALLDPVSEKPLDEAFGNKDAEQKITLPAKQSKSFYFKLKVPDRVDMVKYKAVAAAGDQSDGEEGVLPILSRRIFVQESIPLPIRNAGEKKFKFEKLINSAKSDTIEHKSFTVQMCSNPSWYAIQALPFLMEFPHECSEQTFNRLYANGLAKHIADSDTKIRRVFDLWRGTDALKSNLEKNEQLKSVMLLETPWVLQAKSESQAKRNVGILFDDNRLKSELKSAYEKLKNMQLADGSWPWFPGGYKNEYITLYIVTGFGRMKNLEVNAVSFDLAIKALMSLDNWIDEMYRYILKYGHKNDNNLSSTVALYLYGRSFFLKDQAIASNAREAVDYFLAQAKQYWLKLDCRMSQGHLALALNRFGDKETAKKIMASIKERSQSNEEMGMFWGETELSWWWYRAPIETQALMIEAFAEVMDDKKAVEDCKVWLLKQKQTQDWKTTTATADSIYALICRGDNLLASDALVEVKLGANKVEPEKVEAGTGFYEKRYDGASVKPEFGDITVKKTDSGVAWGGAHWQYMEDMSKITPHTQNPLTLKKTVFVKRDSKAGPVIEPLSGALEVGDLLTIRIELRTDRDMEYVHMKDQRGSGLEPVNVLSQYKYQDGLRYYESTKDSATHFYIDYLPKGTYVFEYELRVQHKGRYQNGMANIECMYAPEFNSHSGSVILEVK